MSFALFETREEAGWRLADRLEQMDFKNPLVLAIPRGGVEVALPIAKNLDAELDVVLSRKLKAPYQPELALGAVSETGEVYLNHHTEAMDDPMNEYIEAERERQLDEIDRRKKLFRAVRPPASAKDRSVIIVDDGIATGSTMIAALKTIRAQRPHEVIVAVPVAPREKLEELRPLCDGVVCLTVPDIFWAVGQFYRRFPEVSDERVVEVLHAWAANNGRQQPTAIF